MVDIVSQTILSKSHEKNAKTYVADHRGLVGSAIVKNLINKGYTNIITRTHSEVDLSDSKAVQDFF